MTRKPTINTNAITRKQLADAIDAYDAEIKSLNEGKSDTYKSYREQLETGGMDGRRASAELAATKAAIVRRRNLAKDPTKVREKDDLTDEILDEIMPSLTRAREEAPRRTLSQMRGVFEGEPRKHVELNTEPATTAADQAEGPVPSPHGSSANQSTAARTDVQRTDQAGGAEPQRAEEDPQGRQPPAIAGTQAPPVDTNSETAGATVDNGGKEPAAVESLPATTFKPGSIRYERTPAIGIVRHDYQRCFPEAWGPALGDLKDDIRANGIREPILMQGNVLLDGWSRFMAARDLQVDYPVQEYDGTDPLADIIKLNMASRKLNLAERVSIARKLIKAAPDREADIGELLDLEQVREAAQ